MKQQENGQVWTNGLECDTLTSDLQDSNGGVHMESQGEKFAYKQDCFQLDAIEGKTFLGWSDGLDWNGWELPAFEIEEALKIVASIRDVEEDAAPCPEDYPNGYNKEKGSLFLSDGSFVEVRRITVEDGTTREVYDIGAYAWCWSKDSK